MQLMWFGVTLAVADLTQMRNEGDVALAVDSVGDVPLLGSHDELDVATHKKMVSSEARPHRELSLWEEMRRDPVVVVSVLLLLAGLVMKMLPQKAPKGSTIPTRPKPSASSVMLNKQLQALQTSSDVLDAAVAGGNDMDLLNLLTALQRAARLRPKYLTVEDPRVLALLEKVLDIMEKDPNASARRAVSTMLRATVHFIGKTNCTPPEAAYPVLDRIIDFLWDHMPEFEPNELTHAVCAFSDLRYRRSDVLQSCVRSSAQWSTWSDVQLVWMAWACARLVTQSSARALPAVAEQLRALHALLCKVTCSSVPSRLMGMLAWSTVQLHMSLEIEGEEVKAFLQKLADDATTRVEKFSVGEACSVLWALGKLTVTHKPFFDAWRDRALAEDFQGYKGMDMANIACAFVNTNHDDDAFLARLGVVMEQRASVHFTDVERQMVRWAYSRRPLLVAPKLK